VSQVWDEVSTKQARNLNFLHSLVEVQFEIQAWRIGGILWETVRMPRIRKTPHLVERDGSLCDTQGRARTKPSARFSRNTFEQPMGLEEPKKASAKLSLGS